MAHKIYSLYVPGEGCELFTIVCLPAEEGKFPTMLYRSPYVDDHMNIDNESSAKLIYDWLMRDWVNAGYAVVFQMCRGTGKSTGEFVPFIYERTDGIGLQNWVRQQPFYNGELYLVGASYTAAVHYETYPFAPDIKAACLSVMDTERYNLAYLNGHFKIGLYGNWFCPLYKKKSGLQKKLNDDAFRMLPMTDFTKTVLTEQTPDFDGILMHPDRNDPFWDTYHGGCETRYALQHANIPLLLTTGFCDIFSQGVIDMWNYLDEDTKKQSAFYFQPYEHGATCHALPYGFDDGGSTERLREIEIAWLDHVRGKGPSPLKKGEITYYELFGKNGWQEGNFTKGNSSITIPLGSGEHSYTYDPANPTRYTHGLTHNFGACVNLDPPEAYKDAVVFYTDEFKEDVHVRGKMRMKLRVRSDCEDTCFYVIISLCKKEGDLTMRDDIHSISTFCPDYVPGTETDMEFIFDSAAFVIGKGERLRIDVTSSAFPLFVPHTNMRGLYTTQTECKIAHNSVIADESELTINYI